MRIFHINGDSFVELGGLPDRLPEAGFVWIGYARTAFQTDLTGLQERLRRWTGGELVDLHISDLLNQHLPSHFDSTSWYDLLVFRRLGAGPIGNGTAQLDAARALSSGNGAGETLAAIDTSPVGFAVFDRVLLSVHPADCLVRDHFAQRLAQQGQTHDARNATRLPPSAADLMLRMTNQMVDGYLDLRRKLTRDLGESQQLLFDPRSHAGNWRVLLDLRQTLHQLEDICEDQRSAITEWIDELDEWPQETEDLARRTRDLLRVRSRDVLEHIERVLTHVRRLESAAETTVQMHFSTQSHRTNRIMQTLTVLTAIFLPLNLVTGFFGMNFDRLPLIHSSTGFWIVVGLLVSTGAALSLFFWRKRYLGSSR